MTSSLEHCRGAKEENEVNTSTDRMVTIIILSLTNSDFRFTSSSGKSTASEYLLLISVLIILYHKNRLSLQKY